MKVSIITVTYNSVQTLERCIKSVLQQDYSDIEYIVIDGASDDGTLRLLDQYRSHISKIRSEPDQGLYDAINKGIGMASGEIIALLHSDDFYTSAHVVSDVVKVFEREHCDAVYSNLYYVSKDNSEHITRKWISGAYKEGAFLRGWMPPHPTFFVTRRCYEQYGTYNLQFRTAADYELMLRFIHGRHISLAYLPEFTVKMSTGGQSNASILNRIKANLEDRKAWEINGLKPRWYTLLLKPLRKLGQFMG
ncbi:MAG TPA: glycosyltransferase family 2 protein [Bacteroidia bacterium]|nr:glycosyltransferase family 2 protein [Bacteroidia bacterium]